jgi:PAS domain S-box-containing protein
VLIAFWVRFAADAYLGTAHIFSTFYAAIAITAWIGGRGPALLAMGVGYFLCDLFFIPPRGTLYLLKFNTFALAGAATYLFVGGVIVATNEALRQARRREHALLRKSRQQGQQHRRLIEREQAARHEAAEVRRALQQREEYRLIAEAVPYGIWKCDRRGRLSYVSQSLLDLIGMDLEAVQRFGWTRRLVDQPQAIRAQWLKCMRSGDPWQAELRFLGADGAEHYVLSRGYPVRDAQGAITSWVGINLDIDDQKRVAAEREQLQAQLQKQLAELAAVDRNKDQFLGMLAHELRNPIAAICAAVDVLRARKAGQDEVQEMLSVLARQAVHLTRLVDDLLDVSRIGQGKILLKFERCDLGEIVRGAIRDYEPYRVKSQSALVLRLPEAPVWVKGDRVRLAQIIGNLLHNAFKFAPHAEIAVELDAEPESEDTCLIVRDSGIGMGPETLAHVFDPFHQGANSVGLTQGGIGLGLAVVKGLVELHSGRITAASAGPGLGSEFRVWLPRLEAATSMPLRIARPASHLRILLVEDQSDTALSTQRLLGSRGHLVEVARDGHAALALAADFHPDAILCDVGLPEDMDGYAIAGVLRQNLATSGIYLVALTEHGSEKDRQLALAAGFDEHLVKPLDVGALENLLARVHHVA